MSFSISKSFAAPIHACHFDAEVFIFCSARNAVRKRMNVAFAGWLPPSFRQDITRRHVAMPLSLRRRRVSVSVSPPPMLSLVSPGRAAYVAQLLFDDFHRRFDTPLAFRRAQHTLLVPIIEDAFHATDVAADCCQPAGCHIRLFHDSFR